ncbi:hypothetical protein BC829DRAFT_449382 [Chytridium lagenaria]|nr:hypothetical protein BC829DRAFT_449382 [Chytridium lagenaria]
MVESSEPQDLVTVLISVGVQTAIAFGLIFAFSLLRPANKVVYQPRLKFAPESKRPKALGPEPTAWISPIFSVNENASIALLGLFTILFLFGVPMIFIYFFYARIVGKPADTGVSLAPVNNVNNGVQISQAVITRTTARTVSGTVFNEAVTSTIDFTLTTTATSGILTSNAPSSSAATDAPTTNVATTDAASITEAPVVTDAPVPSVTDAAPVPSTTAEAAPAVRANFNQRFHGFHLGKRNDDDLTGAVPAQVAFGLKHKVVLGHGMDVELLRRDLERRDVNLSAIKFPNPSLANLTMSMIDVDHPMYWLPASLTWLISIIVYLSLLHVWMDYIKFRKQYFVSDEFQKEFHHRLLLLTNLPDSLTDSESLLKYMSSLGLKYPPKAAIINRNAGDLSKLIVKHEKATKSLEAILAKYLDNPDNLPAERPTMKDASGSKVDAISHLSNEINELEERIYALRAIPDSSLRPTASAFVAFESIKGAHSAARKIRENPTILIQGHIITPPKIKPSPAL